MIEFTDPDCPFCRALHNYWATKESKGTHVRRLVFFVTGIHPEAAAKAEHILCSPDPAAEFASIYAGNRPATLRTCAAGADRLAAHTKMVHSIGVSGTPTLVLGGHVVAGFREPEIEAYLAKPKVMLSARR